MFSYLWNDLVQTLIAKYLWSNIYLSGIDIVISSVNWIKMVSPIPTAFEAESHVRRMSLDGGNSIRLTTSNDPSIPSDSILTSPNYSYIFGFEKDFDHVEVKEVRYVSNINESVICGKFFTLHIIYH